MKPLSGIAKSQTWDILCFVNPSEGIVFGQHFVSWANSCVKEYNYMCVLSKIAQMGDF